MKSIADKVFGETQNTHSTFHKVFFDSRAVYEIMWKNAEEQGRP
jgi:hypothetical protein